MAGRSSGPPASWFTSDLHLGHANVIAYCNRPFANVDEMNAALIDRWNAVVRPDDTVYLLGDFALGPKERVPEFRKALAGRIVLVLGNHDRSPAFMRAAGFETVVRSFEAVVDGTPVSMRHRPFDGTGVRLCGHVHGRWARQGTLFNVGVDVRDFRPVSLGELLGTPHGTPAATADLRPGDASPPADDA